MPWWGGTMMALPPCLGKTSFLIINIWLWWWVVLSSWQNLESSGRQGEAGDCLDCIDWGGRPTHCGWCHSLAGILGCVKEKGSWAAAHAQPSASRLGMPCEHPLWWTDWLCLELGRKINPFSWKLLLSEYSIKATGRTAGCAFPPPWSCREREQQADWNAPLRSWHKDTTTQHLCLPFTHTQCQSLPTMSTWLTIGGSSSSYPPQERERKSLSSHHWGIMGWNPEDG